MIKKFVIISLAFTICSCNRSKGTMTDIVENILEENQGITIDITPHKEGK